MEILWTLIIGAFLFAVAFTILGKPVLGWIVMGLTCLILNFYLGAAWIVMLPGAVSRQDTYMPWMLAAGIQVVISVGQLMLFSGRLTEGPVDQFTEYLWVAIIGILSISDWIANTIPIAVPSPSPATLFAEWEEWFVQTFNSPMDLVANSIVLILALGISLGGEISIIKIQTLTGGSFVRRNG